MKPLAYDTETTGLDLHAGHRMFAFSTCDHRGRIQVVRLDGARVRQVKGRRMLEDLWFSPRTRAVPIAAHDAKFDLTATEGYLGRPLDRRRLVHCTLTLAKVIRSDLRSYELADLLWVFAGYPKDDENLVRQLASTGASKDYSKVPEWAMNKYQAGDSERCALIALFLLDRLKSDTAGVRNVYEWEQKLIWTTMDIEKRGIYLRQNATRRLRDQLIEQANQALDKVESLAGRQIKPKGPQIGKLLYDELGLPVLARTDKGAPSTRREVLLDLQRLHPNPILDAILEYRSYDTGRAAVEGYIERAALSDGIIHPDINTVAAKTGRESCSRPPMHGMSRTGHIDNPYPVPARRCFGPRPGYFTLHGDYSGLEMRTLVEYSDCPVMIQAFLDGVSPHALAAEIWYGSRYTKGSPGERKALYEAAKQGNFAWHYGAGVRRMAEVLQLTEDEVKQRLPAYRRRFPGADTLPRRMREVVLAQGYVTTVFGRRIYVPRHKPYIGVNYIGQGTGADIIKRAQVRVAEYLEQRWGDETGILLPIHDELIIECPLNLLPKVQEIVGDVTQIMIDFPEMHVPLEVEWNMSQKDWHTLHAVQ